MESRYGHAGEPPTKKWQIVCAIVQGKTYEEIGQQQNRATMTIWSAAKALGLCDGSGGRAMPAFYDFGEPVTAEEVRALRKITGLPDRQFAIQTGIGTSTIRPRRKGHRIQPASAMKVVAWRDNAVRQLLKTVAAPARGENRYSGSRILKTLFPGLRSQRDFLLKILRRCRAVLANTPTTSEYDLGEWFCDQAMLEGGRAPGQKLFVRFLPWAPELISFLHKNSSRLTDRGSLWPLADEAIAQRWSTTAAIVSSVGRHRMGRAIRPSEMRHLLLELSSGSRASEPKHGPDKKPAKRGRPIEKRAIFEQARNIRNVEKLPYPQIAKRLTPEAYKANPRKAGEAIRRGIERL